MAVNFALSAARAHARAGARDTRTETKKAASAWRTTHPARREADLAQMGIVIPLSDWLGHNNGPDILDPATLVERQWRKAREAAFAPPDMETGRRWARMAEKLGLTYAEYRLELLERGRHPTEEDARRIRCKRLTSARLRDV